MLTRVVALAGVTAAAGVVFFAGYVCGRHQASQTRIETQVKTEAEPQAQAQATSKPRAEANGPTRRDLGRPPTPSAQKLSNGYHRAPSPYMSDVESEIGDMGSPRQENYRMVLVVRMDLKMNKQKTGSLLCHAALGQFKRNYKSKNPNLWEWEHNGRSTVILRVGDEEGLNNLKNSAKVLDILSTTAVDKTGGCGGSVRAVLALGPASSDSISQITRHLQLW